MKQTTVFEGYMSGDHECALLFPEDRIPRFAEARKKGIYMRELFPESSLTGKHRFKITVESVPLE